MGAWGVGMQANDAALDAIGINEKKPAKVLEEGIDQLIKEEDYLGILGLADRALDLKQAISDKTKKKIMVAAKHELQESRLERWMESDDRKDALERFVKRLNGEKVSAEDLAKDNEGLLSKIVKKIR